MGIRKPRLKVSALGVANTGKSSRTGQIFAVIGLLVGLSIVWGAYELGQIRAGHNRFEALERYRLLEREYESVLAESAKLSETVVSLETDKKIDTEAYRRVEAELAELQEEILAQQEDLAFYRGIVADQQSGLRIQDLELLRGTDASTVTMRLVLAQAIRADRRISGFVELNVEGTQDGESLSLGLADLAGDADGKSRLAFSFRYFQNLQADLVLPVGFAPARVTVKLTPNGASAKPLEKSFDWAIRTG
jgi:hypothetical protein